MPIRGVIGIPQTPFLADGGGVDHESLARGVKDRIDSGVTALLTTVIASESARLTPAERRDVLDTVVRVVVGESPRLPVLAGTVADTLEDSLAFGRHAIERGAAGLLVQPPPSALAGLAPLRAHLTSFAATGTRLLMLQDLDWHGTGLSVDTILAAADEIPELRCVKVETAPAGPKYSAIRTGSRGRIHLSGGWAATQLMEALDRGVDAIAAGGSHWTFVRIIELYDAGRRTEARRLFDRLVPMLAFTHQHIDLSNWVLKELAVRQGLYRSSALRSPDLTIDDHHRHIAEELLDDLLTLEQEMRLTRVSDDATTHRCPA